MLLLALTFAVSSIVGQSLADPAKADSSPKKPSEAKTEERMSRTTHSVMIGGEKISYTATAGTLLLKEESGKEKASIFYIAYIRDGVQNRRDRPLTFSFNGGPGSSSVWLHLGLLGPRRVLMGDKGALLRPPFRVGDNSHSLLATSDLVFIDPVMTGYSRPSAGEDPKQFFGLKEDTRSVAEFIRLYATRNGRWSSPKFIIGESYGTTRAAALANYLQDRHGMYLNGILLISSILNFQTARFETGNDLPYALFLPTYTATAWYHKRLAPELQADLARTLREAEEFALGEYTLALTRGNELPAAEASRIAAKVARFTGLSEAYVRQANLRIEIGRFTKELLRDRRTTVGRLDSRFEGIDRDAAGERYEFDPSYAVIQGPYTGAMLDYVREELKFESDLPYEILTDRVRPWSYGDSENKYVNVSEDLRRAMAQNPDLNVFVGSGFYDLATPYFATAYTFSHMGFDPTYAKRVRTETYEAGHMMYVHGPSLEKLSGHLRQFVTDNSKP